MTTTIIWLFAVACSVQAFSQEKQSNGRLAGTIRDENNQPIGNVNVTVEKETKGTTTSISGDYMLVLSAGSFTIVFSAINFSTQRITDVIIKANEQTDLSITLTRSKKDTLRGVVVTSNAKRASVAGLLQLQKNAPDMRDGVSSEQLARLPVNNVAQALAKVSGINIQGDKFVTVRGVSDRYNNAMINGSTLPSTEPNRRNFSFDIVPSALVDNVVVNKTASPDMPGEFTGGLVQINTKDVPSKNFLEISISTGINTESFDRVYNTFKRDKGAAIGKIDKERKWFGDGQLIDPVKYYQQYSANDTAALRKTTSQIPARWQRYRYNYTPVQNYQLSGGMNKNFGKSRSFGFTAAVTYMNEVLYEEGRSASISVFAGNNIRTRYTTSIGALFNTAYKTKNHKIAWKNIYNKRYSLQSDFSDVNNVNFGYPQQRFTDVVFSGSLLQTRIDGEHLLTKKGIKADWNADYIDYKREQPDTRYITFGILDSANHEPVPSYNFTDRPIVWGALYSGNFSETRNNAGINLSFPFQVKEQKQLIKIGYAYSKREAENDASAFRLRYGDNAFSGSSSLDGLPYYEIITRENITKGIIAYYPVDVVGGKIGDKYSGTQVLNSFYGMADIRFLKKMRFIGGFRNENNRMDVRTNYFVLSNTSVRVVDTTISYPEKDWLPSVNLIYSINNKINLRAAFSKTLARPDFFERSSFTYFDFAEQLQVYGDDALKITRIKNYDLRFEYYPSAGEILSASLFYKDFDQPVERFFEQGNPSNSVQYKNLFTATARGFEVDLRKNIGFINPASKILDKMVFSGNFTYIAGDLTGAVTKKNPGIPAGPGNDTFYVVKQKRPIQNLAPYIINLGLAYQQENWGLNLAYNRTGRKIVNGGIESLIIQYENPRDLLDFQLNARLYKQKMELRFNVSNILDAPFIIYANHDNTGPGGAGSPDPNHDPKGDAYNKKLDFITYSVKKGVGLSVKAVYKF